MNLDQLKAIRQRGERPELLYLSLVGPLKIAPTIVVQPEFDPRLMVGMDAVIVHAGRQDRRVIELADSLASAGIWNLEAWNLTDDRRIAIWFAGKSFMQEVPSW